MWFSRWSAIRSRLGVLCDHEGIGASDPIPERIMLEAGMTPADIAELRRDFAKERGFSHV
jgi:hypothetical protein